MKNLLRHLRRHAPAYVAMVVSLVVAPTSAYAVATIRSADIVDGEVKAPDLALNAVRGPKVLDGSLVNQDLAAGTIAGDKVADGSLSGTDIADGTVGGADVNESSLSTVPSALQAVQGRRRHRVVATLTEVGHELRSDQAGATDDDEFHDRDSFLCRPVLSVHQL